MWYGCDGDGMPSTGLPRPGSGATAALGVRGQARPGLSASAGAGPASRGVCCPPVDRPGTATVHRIPAPHLCIVTMHHTCTSHPCTAPVHRIPAPHLCNITMHHTCTSHPCTAPELSTMGDHAQRHGMARLGSARLGLAQHGQGAAAPPSVAGPWLSHLESLSARRRRRWRVSLYY